MNATLPEQAKSRRGTRRFRRRFLMRLIAIAAGCALAIGIAEVGLRFAGIGMPNLYVPDHFCGSRLRPSTAGVWMHEGHGHISINANGFRGPTLPATKASHVFRIATLGDSFIEALQVDEHATLCFQLQRLLNAASSDSHRRYEVINCGVSGYGTAQELQMLRHHVLPLAPDAVLLAIYPENDIRNNLRSLEQDPARPYFTINSDGNLFLDNSFRTSIPFVTASSLYERRKAAVINRSRVLQVLQHAKKSMFNAEDIEDGPANAEDALYVSVKDASYTYASPTTREHQRAWRITQRLIEELARECETQQVPLFVFTVSSPAQVYPDSRLRRRVEDKCGVADLFYAERRIQAICSDADIRFCSLASQLQTAVDESGSFLHGFSNSRLGFGHWNESGHLAAAQILSSWLLRDGQYFVHDTEKSD
jgi:lysophospholipase L1-like esterase